MNSDIVSEFWKNYLDDLLAECREIGRLPPQHRVRELGKLRAARRELIKCIWNDALAEARARATDTHRAEAVEARRAIG